MMIEDTRSSEEKLEQALSMISGQELPYTAPEKLCEVPGTFDAELVRPCKCRCEKAVPEVELEKGRLHESLDGSTGQSAGNRTESGRNL